jgi:hypothetical protein
MSAALAPSSCNQGCDRGAHQLSERAHAPANALTSTMNPLKITNIEWWSCVCGGGFVQSGYKGNVGVVLCHGKPMFRCAGVTPTHVLHASTRLEHGSSNQKSAMRRRLCGQ